MLNSKIIIAVNNYEMDNYFVNYGVELAKRLDRPASLIGVTRIPRPVDNTGLTAMNAPKYEIANIETVQKNQEAALQKVYMKAREQYHKIDYEVEIGFPEAMIIDKARKEQAYMILVEGNSTMDTLSEWFGTYETRLAEHSSTPVLVVPAKNTWKPVQDILYVMELDDNKAKNIRRLYNLATTLNANLHIMLSTEEVTEATTDKYNHIVETMRTFYNYQAVRYSLISNVESAKEIGKMAERMVVDWLAIEHSEESFINRIFSDLNSDRIILQSKIPVLVF
jgi:nucleotide-binding universal stress UspA family protein